jgi:D-glycero-alpha-D-manno-heptose 1-phosphate guanylyltransferase
LIDASKPVFVLNGDTFLRMDYKVMLLQHHWQTAKLTMALRKIPDTSRYGVVITEQDKVVEFKEQGGPHAGLINAGVYLLDPALLNGVDLPEQFSFERDFLFPHIATLKPSSYLVDGYFIDIGIPEDYTRAVNDFENR